MELWDAYHGDGTLAGRDLVWGEPIPEGFFHLVSEVTVRHRDGDFLVMQRALTKLIAPGTYEATAGGSALKGETAQEAAMRELFEETGIRAETLSSLYRIVDAETKSIYCGYGCRIDHAKDDIVLQEGETEAYLWLGEDAFLELLRSKKYAPSHKRRLLANLDKVLLI